MGLTAYIVGKCYILMRSQHYWFTCQNSNDIIILYFCHLNSSRILVDASFLSNDQAVCGQGRIAGRRESACVEVKNGGNQGLHFHTGGFLLLECIRTAGQSILH